MPIELPDFKNSHCVAITICAQLKSTDGELKKLMRKETEAMGAFQTALGETYLRMMFGGKQSKHLHLDIAPPGMTIKSFAPKSKFPVHEIQKRLEPFAGKEVQAKIKGYFRAKIEELPERGVIRTMFFETKTGQVGIQVKGAQLQITGAPINEFSWQVTSKNEIGVIVDSAIMKLTISDKYLLNALDMLETAFNYIILGKAPNEPQ